MQRWKQSLNWSPGAVWPGKKTPNLPTSCTSCRWNADDQPGRLCPWSIWKAIGSSHRRKRTSSDSCAHWRQEHRGEGPDWNLSCPHSRSRVQHSVGGHAREVRWTVTPREGKDSDSSDSRKNLLFLYFDLFCRIFWIFLSFFPPFLPPLWCSCQFYWHYEI